MKNTVLVASLVAAGIVSGNAFSAEYLPVSAAVSNPQYINGVGNESSFDNHGVQSSIGNNNSLDNTNSSASNSNAINKFDGRVSNNNSIGIHSNNSLHNNVGFDGRNDQSQGQKQGQHLDNTNDLSNNVSNGSNNSSNQGQKQNANNNGNAQNVNFNSPKQHRMVPSMANFVPMPTSPCMATIGGAGAGAGFGFSISGSYINENCEIQEAAKAMLMIGQHEAAVEIACTGKHAVNTTVCREIAARNESQNTEVKEVVQKVVKKGVKQEVVRIKPVSSGYKMPGF